MSATMNYILDQEQKDLDRCDRLVKTPFGNFDIKHNVISTPFGEFQYSTIKEVEE